MGKGENKPHRAVTKQGLRHFTCLIILFHLAQNLYYRLVNQSKIRLFHIFRQHVV